jgi:catechol 2,3-dioxygenase-like lactoylglutathione lyase family enzyme
VLARLDHVILAVGDLEAATRSYARLLGRSPSWRGEHPGAGSVNALFRLENITLELLAPAGEGPVGAAVCAWLSARGEGPLGLAFGTDDAETCRGWLAARGLDPGAVEKGMGRDVDSGAFREWLRVPIPLTRTRGVPIFAIERLSAEALLPSAAALGDEAAAVHALDHAVVRTADPEAARALYGEALGLRLALDREFAQWGVRLLFFRVGGVTVELAAALPGATVYPTHPEGAEAPASREPREGGAGAGAPAGSDTQRGPEARAVREGGDRLWGLSWRVRDADGARARLASAGFSVSEVRPGRRPGTRVFGVRDGTHGVPTLVLEPEAR